MDNVLQTLLTPNDNIPAAKDMPIMQMQKCRTES